jgi:hypothetical protein
VQSEARVPSQRVAGLSAPLLAGAGAIGGALLGLGLVALLSVMRRPVIVPADITSVLDVPLLGTVALGPRGRPVPRNTPGIAPVTRRLAGVRSGRLVFASDVAMADARRRLILVLATTLSSFRRVSVAAVEPLPEFTDSADAAAVPTPWRRSAADRSGTVVLVDGEETPEMLAHADTPVSVVLVVRRGTPQAELRAMADGYLPEELFGVILVEVRGTRHRAQRADPTPTKELSPATTRTVAL